MDIGQIIGTGLFFYFLLGLTLIVPIASLTYLILSRKLYSKGHLSGSLLSFELLFGLLQPLLYLIFIFPAIWDTDQIGYQILHYCSFIILGSVWLSRCIPFYRLSPNQRKLISRSSSAFCVALIGLHAGLGLTVRPDLPFMSVLIFYPVAATHYLVPMLMAIHHWRLAGKKEEAGEFYFMILKDQTRHWPQKMLVLIAATIAGVPLLSTIGSSKTDARFFIESHRDLIIRSARENSIDPLHLAAVAYTARHRAILWKPAFERLVMDLWLVDAKSHLLLSRSMDLSVGPTQIKPTTAQTALIIFGSAWHQLGYQEKVAARIAVENDQYYFYEFYKEYRDAWQPSAVWNLTKTSLQKVTLPVQKHPNREALINDLLDPEQNLRFCAFILGLYAAQWDQLAPASGHRNDPAILATLYQIGFAKSKPHSAPKASNFGKAAARAAEEDWLKQLF